MAGALRKTMAYLGLAEEDHRYKDEYDQYSEYGQDYSEGYDEYADHGHETEHDFEPQPAAVTPLRKNTVAAVAGHPKAGDMSRINAIHPRTYNEAKDIGESFRDGIPVIMNLSDMDDTDAKRLVDFAAGLVFGLHGTIERVTAKVFLLSPAGVEVATTGTDGKSSRGLFNQS
ncbi:cell division protein SepF [Yimella sp. cx-51]|uniref:cell division protein SepF n=1 Tax=Yimella sp. cx-51 TaxID=2770551 RepID=UPI00165DC76F|nr:cell division protein SepF [Yimella sp. cx-51]MBC9957277.1 cell division protein SepF [Yimella sp. cx-51]MBD2758592.1 cell division protein SepF [Yimella sp. cx-573]QTH37084.1 cell division protein SepF [Yimella sp. cx-51]